MAKSTANLITEVTEHFATAEEAAEIFGLSTARLNGLITEKRVTLEKFKLYNRVLYCRDDVKAAAANYTPRSGKSGYEKIDLMVLANSHGISYNQSAKKLIEELEAKGVDVAAEVAKAREAK